MIKKETLLIAAVAVLMLTSIQCTQKEQEQARDNTSNAVNDAAKAVTGFLRDVADGINDAVYNKK